MNSELLQIANSEVQDLLRMDALSNLSQDDLRKASVGLNSLLVVDGKGWLFQLAKAVNLKINVVAPDNGATLKILDNSTEFYLCGGVGLGGMKLRELIEWGRALSREEMAARAASQSKGPILQTISLSKFLKQTCIVESGVPVCRSTCIRYVANKRGGKHFDEKRTGKLREQFEALDRCRVYQFTNNAIEPAHFELLATAHYLVNSPDVLRLVGI